MHDAAISHCVADAAAAAARLQRLSVIVLRRRLIGLHVSGVFAVISIIISAAAAAESLDGCGCY